MVLEIVRLTAHHNVLPFRCGEDEIDRYLKSDARKQNEDCFAATYVAVDPAEPAEVHGFYSLQVSELMNAPKPPELKKLKGFSIPIVKVAYFGVHQANQRTKIGETMLIDLYRRALLISNHVGCYAVCLEAISDNAVAFYQKYSMIAYGYDPKKLWIRVSDIGSLLELS